MKKQGLKGMNAVRSIENRLRYIIANRLSPDDAKTDIFNAIEEIVSLKKRIEDPRTITITRERHDELLKHEERYGMLLYKYRHSKKENH